MRPRAPLRRSVALLAACLAPALGAACDRGSVTDARDADRQAWGADPFAGRADPCADPAEEAARRKLEAERLRAGAGAVRCLAPLGALARDHAAYLAQSDAARRSPHLQRSGEPGFRGATLAARAGAAGIDPAAVWVGESIGGLGLAPAAVVERHLASVYHRGILLAPGVTAFAFGSHGGAPPVLVTMAPLGSAAPLAVYPPPDALGVPTAFDPRLEEPSPAGVGAPSGYPVSAHAARRLDRRTGAEMPLAATDLAVWAITEDGPEPVAGRLLRARAAGGDDPDLSPADVVFVPAAPLAAGVWHEARLSPGGPVWRFRTASDKP